MMRRTTMRDRLLLLTMSAVIGVSVNGFELRMLVAPSYRIVEDSHEVVVTYTAASDLYVLRYAAHDIVRQWDSLSGLSDVVEQTVPERTEEYVALSPFAAGTHVVAAVVLDSVPAEFEHLTIGGAATVAADDLPPADPSGPGLGTADTLDDELSRMPAALVSPELQALGDMQQATYSVQDAAITLVDESAEVGNERTTGDPVLVASGMLTTAVTDLELYTGAVPIIARRVHRSDLGLAGSLGSAWWFSLDTRIVFGESPGADGEAAVAEANAESILSDDVQTLDATYTASRERVETLLAAAGARRAEEIRTRDALSLAKLTYHGDHRQIIVDELDRQLHITAELIAADTEVVEQFQLHLQRLDVAYGTVNTGSLGALHATAAEQAELARIARLRSRRAADNAERNGRFVPGQPRSATQSFPAATAADGVIVASARASGNDVVTVIDPNGIPHRHTYRSAADLESRRTYADGAINYFPAGAEFRAEDPTGGTLILASTGEFVLSLTDGTRWTYGRFGELLRIEDRNGNRADLIYGADEQLCRITDSRGREVGFIRRIDGRLTDIVAPVNTVIHYEYDSSGQIAAITDPDDDTVRFGYDGLRIERVTKPDGSFREYRYAVVRGAVRAVETVDEEGKAETFDFGMSGSTVHTNPSGIHTTYTFGADRRVSRVSHEGGTAFPSGLFELFTYSTGGDLVYHRATDGSEYRYDYDRRHNLLRIDEPDGTAESWTYNGLDLPATHTDRLGDTTVFTYDARGNLLRMALPDQTAELYTYIPPGGPAAGAVATHTDRRGNIFVYDYDEYGFVRSVTDSIGLVAGYEHDAFGRVTVRVDGVGNRFEFTYTAAGRLDTVTGPENLSIDYEYDGRKDLIAVNRNGRVTSFRYDHRHLLAGATNALSMTLTYDRRADGLVVGRTLVAADAFSGAGVRRTTLFGYDGRGLLEREIRVEAGTEVGYEHDRAGRTSAVIDEEGRRSEYRYTFDGLPFERTRYLDGRPVVERVDFYPYGTVKAVTDAMDRVTRWERDPVRRSIVRVDARAKRAETLFGPYGLVETETDSTGRTRTFERDVRGRIVRVWTAGRVLAAYTYDAADRRTGFTDGEGNEWAYEYDGLGHLIAAIGPDGKVRTITYNRDGTVQAVTDEVGLTTSYEYDELGRVSARTDPSDATDRRTEYLRGPFGAVEAVTDPTRRTIAFDIDASGRVVGRRDNAGMLTSYEYDRSGTLTAVVDATGRRTDYQTDDLGRLTSVRVAGQQVARYEYDGVGNLRFVFDGAERPHEYRYDDVDRVTGELDAFGSVKTYQYDDAGRTVSVNDYDGTTTALSYDTAGRLSEVSVDDGPVRRFAYDQDGHIAVASLGESELSFSYDSRGHLSSVTGEGETQVYVYDAAGRRIRLDDLATHRSTEYRYDARGLLSEVRDSVAGTTALDYDAAGRQVMLAAANGIVTTTVYDTAGRVAAIVDASPTVGVVAGVAYLYDDAGRRTFDVRHDGAITSYAYDASGRLSESRRAFSGPTGDSSQERLTLSRADMDGIERALRLIYPLRKVEPAFNLSVWIDSLAYDAAGNRVLRRTGRGDVTYTYDADGRLVRAGDASYDFDVAGNLTHVTSTSGATRYTYTHDNRLASAETPDTAVTYAYDAFGRRSMRTEVTTRSPEAVGGALSKNPGTEIRETTYRYDGFSMALTSRVEQSYTSPGNLESLVKDLYAPSDRYRRMSSPSLAAVIPTSRRTVYEEVPTPAADGRARSSGGLPVAISGPSGTRYLAGDVLGSARLTTDDAGAVVRANEFDAFGMPGDPPPDAAQPYGFAGKRRDVVTGLIDHGYRDYDPATGRFTTADPVKAGANWYTYAGNDPVNTVDPWGLAPRNLTASERRTFKTHVEQFADESTTLPTYEDGTRKGQTWDCADLATYIVTGALDAATNVTESFRTLTAGETPLTSIPDIHSSDFATDGNITFYRNADNTVDNTFDSLNVEAGTIGVFSNHIIVITADRDDVTDPLKTIQGHLTRDADWPDIPTQDELDGYLGDFIGWAEIGSESTTPPPDVTTAVAESIKNR